MHHELNPNFNRNRYQLNPETIKSPFYQVGSGQLSTSNLQSQYSGTQGVIPQSENTLVNLLMYESEYVPIAKKQDKNQLQQHHQIQEAMNEEELTYYHDNTQDHQYQPSEEDSEDLFFTFIVKLVGALSYRIRIEQRNAFEEIYLCATKRCREEAPIAMDLSDSQSQKSKQQFDHLDSPFNSAQPPDFTVTAAKVLPQLMIEKNPKIRVKLNDQSSIPTQLQKQFNLQPSARLQPDVMKEQSIDECGFGDNFDLVFFENSSYDNDTDNSIKICPENPIKVHLNQYKVHEVPIRPVSYYCKGQSPVAKVVGNVKPVKPNDYCRPVTKPSPQPHPEYQYKGITMNKNPQVKKIHITYKNKEENPIHRSQSNFQLHHQRSHSPSIKVEPNVNLIRSQYYITQNAIPQNVVIHKTPLKRVASTSSVLTKFKHQPCHEDFRKSPKKQSLQETATLEKVKGPLTQREVSPNPTLQLQKKAEEKFNQYYEFTRPITKETQATNCNSRGSLVTNKSSKGKKITVFSNRKNNKR